MVTPEKTKMAKTLLREIADGESGPASPAPRAKHVRRCEDCDDYVSNRAIMCPHCGAPGPSKSNSATAIIANGILRAALWVFCMVAIIGIAIALLRR